MLNGIMTIEPFDKGKVTQQDVLGAIITAAGGSVSDMPNEVEGNIAYSNRWELFDPRRVTEPDELPDHWAAVYKLHNSPDRTDCVDGFYRYVHTPTEILPDYPRRLCKGIFCLTDNFLLLQFLTANDLVHIGNEVCEEMESVTK